MRYAFRDLAETDLPLMRAWLDAPHARAWWGEPDDGVAEMRATIDDPATRAFVVEHDGAPIAYMQHYDPHAEDGHPYRDQPPGTLGLDLTIGPREALGRGHGPAILEACAARLFADGAVRLIVDPDPANTRAIRAYEKAGFAAFDERTSIYGPALMMARDA